jgi:hypothetical protein
MDLKWRSSAQSYLRLTILWNIDLILWFRFKLWLNTVAKVLIRFYSLGNIYVLVYLLLSWKIFFSWAWHYLKCFLFLFWNVISFNDEITYFKILNVKIIFLKILLFRFLVRRDLVNNRIIVIFILYTQDIQVFLLFLWKWLIFSLIVCFTYFWKLGWLLSHLILLLIYFKWCLKCTRWRI